ncbi:nucleotidyltransferase family protein [Dictyoglomus thermophilum]|jgi:predicted nucleotidyltransferase|uniref:Nucleotidyltransferase n=1 Tax=Dictyoglomus thermophilum (strain ATCC 35947 / DSM 3960 / H-6-12) TaxID=309799 RepID=B5YBB5_DICT6|nr:nucleotidyltransferase [Dictyoglomus thermophilum]ACI18711.1 nucleotidyltransferase [Dictyoglomus thermophilum H-6-12]
MKKEEIIEKLKENREKIKSFGVKKLGIFGSVVRGELREDSDIDFVVEFERGKATFKNVAGLIDFLEELFGREIDILTPDGIENIRIKHIKEEIKREIEYV